MLEILPIFGLALLDSLSAGTLVIPLMLVLNQRGVKIRPLTVYFLTVCLSYFAIGAALLLGLDQLQDVLARVLSSEPVLWIQLGLGAILLVYGVAAPDPKKVDHSEVKQPRNLSTSAIVGVGLSAVAIEAATMVPYLAAIAILTDSGLAMAGRFGVLAAYCLVMIVPALIVIGLVAIFGNRVWERVERMVAWVERETQVTLLWIAAIAGFYLIANAVTKLGLIS